MGSPLKQRVLDMADALFYAEGVRAVGIDRIIEESGVAKASFYRFFPSKDLLIQEWIEMRDEVWRRWLQESVEMLAPEPNDRPLAVFDALYARFKNPAFRGCAFLNTIIELSRTDHPAAQAARAHKASVSALLEAYLAKAGYGDVHELATLFMQLIDGALVTALREQKPDAALRAKEMAAMLLKARRVEH
jgi:AcrR family transcriptional regulator